MKAEIKDNNLVITIPLEAPRSSTSGKTLLVATTNGFAKTTASADGKPISVSVNATIRK